MTIVLAETEDQTVTFAADSAGSWGDEIYTIDLPKAFTLGPYLFGYCGSYRIGQVLRHCLELPEPPASDPEKFLVREVVPILRQAVVDQGAAADGRFFLGEKTTILVAFRGRIWSIGTDLAVFPELSYAAIGSGRLRAYGALHALNAAGVEPARRRLELALTATAEHTANVRPPWHFASGASLDLLNE
jgi:ATP-dependent protease HslVU (ClpYQ) peptidase subunit